MCKNVAVDVKIDNEIIETLIDVDLAQNIHKFVFAKQELDSWTKMVKELKSNIALKAKDILKDKDKASLTFLNEDKAVKVSFSWELSIDNIDLLSEILGNRFNDLVTTKTAYTPTAKLKEESYKNLEIAKCLNEKEKAPNVTVVK